MKIYLDCRVECDENYIRSEISYVDFVFDRFAADVHLLITSQENGSGGSRIQLIFFGQNNFKNRLDTLTYNQPTNATNVERRIQVTKEIRSGIIPFITKMSNAALLEITKGIITGINNDTLINSSKKNVPSTETKDKWNYWVYRVGADGTFNIDENYTISTISTSLSANRTTNKLRANFSLFRSKH